MNCNKCNGTGFIFYEAMGERCSTECECVKGKRINVAMLHASQLRLLADFVSQSGEPLPRFSVDALASELRRRLS